MNRTKAARPFRGSGLLGLFSLLRPFKAAHTPRRQAPEEHVGSRVQSGAQSEDGVRTVSTVLPPRTGGASAAGLERPAGEELAPQAIEVEEAPEEHGGSRVQSDAQSEDGVRTAITVLPPCAGGASAAGEELAPQANEVDKEATAKELMAGYTFVVKKSGGSQDVAGAGRTLVPIYDVATIVLPCGKRVTLDTVVTPPPASMKGPIPLHVHINGFQCIAAMYRKHVDGLAKRGYAVLQYTYKKAVPIVGDEEELAYLEPLLAWLKDKVSNDEKYKELRGRLDFEELSVGGHSRGAKLAALHCARTDGVKTAVLIDPVDGNGVKWLKPGSPSGIEALQTKRPPVAIVGAGKIGKCNPAGENHEQYFEAAGNGSCRMVIQKADHMQFCNETVRAKLSRFICECFSWGTAQGVIADTIEFTVAYLDSHFRPERASLQHFMSQASDRKGISVESK